MSFVLSSFDHFERGPVKRFVFSNGAVFVHHRSPGLKSASLKIWFLAGSREEKKGQEGLAHLFEHMMFRVSRVRGKSMIRELENNGAELNAHTSKEYLCFETRCPLSRLSLNFPLFTSMILAPSFTEHELKEEKKVILQEIREDRDDHDLLAEEMLFSGIYPHDLGHSIIGTFSTVKSLGMKELEKYSGKFLCPPRMVVSLVADVDAESYAEVLNSLMKDLNMRQQAKPIRPVLGTSTGKTKNVIKKITRFDETALALLSFPGNQMNGPFRAELVLLDYYLSEGMSSRLFRALREEEGLVYRFGTEINTFTDNGNYEIFLSSSSAGIEKSIHKTLTILEEIATNGIDGEAIQRVRRALLDSWETAFDDVEDRNEYIGKGELFRGYVPSLKEMAALFEAVTPERIRKLLTFMLKHGPSFVTISKAKK
jgi:predicted Zn-dependent peptidase